VLIYFRICPPTVPPAPVTNTRDQTAPVVFQTAATPIVLTTSVNVSHGHAPQETLSKSTRSGKTPSDKGKVGGSSPPRPIIQITVLPSCIHIGDSAFWTVWHLGGTSKPLLQKARFSAKWAQELELPGTYPHDAQLDCRVGGGGSEHYRTMEALEFSIDPQKKIIPTRDVLDRKRNIGSYDDYGFSRLSTFGRRNLLRMRSNVRQFDKPTRQR
jgi:hypothetical protein